MSRTLLTLFAALTIMICGCNPSPRTEGGDASGKTITMESIIPTGAQPKMLGDQFQFTEGPLWLPDKKVFIFSDIPANKMYQYSPEKGFSVFREPSNFSNGNAIDRDGNLVTAQHDRTITRTDKNGKVSVIAREYKGRKLNSPNDLIAAKNGDIYFTDPHFGLIGYGPQTAPEEQACRGVYRLKPDGKVELMSGDFKIPNGVVFSPKEDVLYVTNSEDGTIHCFDVKADGTLANLRLFAKQPAAENRQPVGDGVRVDKEGNVYAAAPAGVAIYTPQGKLIGQINLPMSASNLAWGAKDMKTLFMTVARKVYSIETLIGGIGR